MVQSKNGFALLKLLMLVAIASMVVIFALIIYQDIYLNIKVNDGKNILQSVKAETRRLYRDEPLYADAPGKDITPFLISTGIIPREYVSESNVTIMLDNPLKISSAVPDAHDLRITVEDMVINQCVKLSDVFLSKNTGDLQYCAILPNDQAEWITFFEASCTYQNMIDACENGQDGQIDIRWRFD